MLAALPGGHRRRVELGSDGGIALALLAGLRVPRFGLTSSTSTTARWRPTP